MKGSDLFKLLPPFILLLAIMCAISFVAFKIGAKTATATIDVEEFKAAIHRDLEQKFQLERQDAAEQRNAIEQKVDDVKERVTDVKDLAKRALSKPPAAVLVPGEKPIPVKVIGTPGPMPTPTVMPDTNPKHGGLFSW